MNFQQLHYMLEICRCGSINKASQTLFVTQPALSLSIKELEAELGFTLFVRSNKGIHPTVEGAIFLNSIQNIVSQIDQIRNQYSSGSNPVCPAVLRISFSRYSFVSNALIKFYSCYFKALPFFSLELNEVDCQQVIQDVFNRKADIGIIHTRDTSDSIQKKDLSNKGIDYKFLFSSHSYVMFRKDHPLAIKAEITPEDIINFPQIRISSRNSDYYSYDTNFNFPHYGNSGKNIFISSRTLVFDFLSKTDAVFLGITDLNVVDFHPDLATKTMYGDNTTYNLYAIRLKSNPSNVYITDFIDLLSNEVSRASRHD